MYGLIIGLSIILTVLYAETIAKKKTLNLEILWELTFIIIIFGLIGARIYHVIDLWDFYKLNPITALAIWKGGLSILGALPAGLLAATIYLKSRKQQILIWTDLIAITLPLGQALGRAANIINRELVQFAIYEAGLNIVLFIFLTLLHSRPQKKGTLTLLYLLGYSSIRFIIEPYRTDLANIQMAQNMNLLIILVTTVLLFIKICLNRNLKKS